MIYRLNDDQFPGTVKWQSSIPSTLHIWVGLSSCSLRMAQPLSYIAILFKHPSPSENQKTAMEPWATDWSFRFRYPWTSWVVSIESHGLSPYQVYGWFRTSATIGWENGWEPTFNIDSPGLRPAPTRTAILGRIRRNRCGNLKILSHFWSLARQRKKTPST